MAIITVPANLIFGTFDFGERRFDITEASESTGNVRIRIGPPPRWTVKIGPAQGPGVDQDQGGLWVGLLKKLQGGVNQLALYNPAMPAPRGTLRGSLTLTSTAAAGATSITVSGGSGTVEAGDAFQIGTGLSSQYIIATDDGNTTFSFGAPLRKSYSAGTVVTWDKPVAHFRMVSESTEWKYNAGNLLMSGLTFDLIEYWEI